MHKYRVGYLLLFCVLLLSVNGLLAQSKINFSSFTLKQGLSSNTVYAILKDKYGLMWFGTSNGLSKFDGTNFTVYRHEAGKPYTLPSNEVLSLYEDREGKIWIGSSAGGLSYYDRTNDKIIPYKGDASWPELGHISPRAILEDHLGKLWIGSYGELRTIDIKTGHSTKLHIQPTNDAQLVVICLFEDSRHRMWVGTNNGLYLYNEQKNSFTRFLIALLIQII